MFYSYFILVRKNSNFSLVWRYMHDKKKVTRQELLNFNVLNACKDLCGYIPTGTLNVQELQNKMSLYLLSQLLYGISLVHRYQTISAHNQANEIIRGLLYHKEEVHKRKRPDADDEEFYDEDRDMGDHSEISAPKKRKVNRRASSVLDLNDPSSYVVEPLYHTSTLMKPSFDADDMFQMPGLPETGLVPAEEFMKLQQEMSEFPSQDIKIEQEMEIDVSLKDMKVSVGCYDDWPPLSEDGGVESARARTMSSHLSAQEALKNSMLFEDSMHQKQQVVPPMVSPPQMPPTEPIVPVYRQTVDSLDSQDEFMLEPLPELVKPAESKSRKRRRIWDDVLTLSSEQILEQLNNYSDLCRSNEDIQSNKVGTDKLSLNMLLNPRPWHITNLSEDLLSLFDLAPKKPEPTLSFKEATKYGLDELRQRYWNNIGFDVQSWNSEMLNETLNSMNAAGDAAMRPPDEFQVDDLPQWPNREATPQRKSQLSAANEAAVRSGFEAEDEEENENEAPPKVSVADLSAFSPERQYDSEVEARRFSSFDHRVSLPQAHFDDFDIDQPLQNDDCDLRRPSLKTAHELSQRTLDSPEANDLFQDILDAINTVGTGVCKFQMVISPNVSKRTASKKFYNLLCLLKQREVKVKQTEAYGDILIRLLPVE